MITMYVWTICPGMYRIDLFGDPGIGIDGLEAAIKHCWRSASKGQVIIDSVNPERRRIVVHIGGNKFTAEESYSKLVADLRVIVRDVFPGGCHLIASRPPEELVLADKARFAKT